jgi:hypothetical protein
MNYRRRFIKYYINRMLHFDITMISRDEDSRAILKRQLSKFTDDLKTVMNDINLILIDELHNYCIALNDDRMRSSIELRKLIFDQLTSLIITNALRKILSQYKLMIERITVLSVCINVSIIITELLCNHRIQKRLFQEECLLIEDIHFH